MWGISTKKIPNVTNEKNEAENFHNTNSAAESCLRNTNPANRNTSDTLKST